MPTEATATSHIELAAMSARTLWLSALLLVGLPGVVTACVDAGQRSGHGVPPQALLAPAVCALVWVILALAARRRRVTLTAGVLSVRSTFYRRDVSLQALDLEHARVFDREERLELRPARKRNAVGLPGFQSGHFVLRTGQRAFVAVASGRWRLWLPCRDGGGLLLEPQDPRALLALLRTQATAPAQRVAALAGNR
ncbi:MAG TPA: hypothetical protein VM687_12090 [Stenotrophomonas sp.]|nr:hypothetical protein [Stenotrophomonas sp.]